VRSDAESKVELRLNLAVFLVLLVPVVSLCTLAAQWFLGIRASSWIVLRSIVAAVLAVAAALPLAARLKAAPPIVALACALSTAATYHLTRMQYGIEDVQQTAWGRESAFGHALLPFWIGLACCGVAWHSRSGLVRPWNRREFLRWAARGLKALVRTDRWVVVRLLVGAAFLAGALALGLSLGSDWSFGGRRALAKGCAALIALGMGSLLTCFRIGLDRQRDSNSA
jgi:hypothetical protein